MELSQALVLKPLCSTTRPLVTLQSCIREVPGSNLGRVIYCSESRPLPPASKFLSAPHKHDHHISAFETAETA